MKKVVFTMLQLAVTAAVLYYVFHDPKKLHQMRQALEQADYRWVFAAVAAYIIVEIAAALRWQILLRVQGIYLNCFSTNSCPVALGATSLRVIFC